MDYRLFTDNELRAEWNRLMSEHGLDWRTVDQLADLCRECDRRELFPWSQPK